MLVLFISSCAVLWLFVLLLRRRRQPPTQPGGWLWNSYYMGLKDEPLWTKVLQLSTNCAKCGGITRLFAGLSSYYVITDPDVIVGVLNACLNKGAFYRFWKPWLGDGAVTASVPIWKPHRRQLNPLFHQRILDDYLDTFNNQAELLVQRLSAEDGNGPFDPFHYLSVINLDTVCLTSFGFSEDVITLRKYSLAVQEINKITRYRFERFWLHPQFVFNWTSTKKAEDRFLKIIHGMSSKLVKRRIAALNESRRTEKTSEDIEGAKMAFIDTLLQLQEEGLYSERQVREEVDTFLLGGHDSVSTTTMYTLVLLGSHPDAQRKVLAELEEVLADNEKVSLSSLSRLVYLEAVLKESLRLYPYAPFISRVVDSDVELKDYTLTAGSTLFVLLWGTHRHPMWGPDADQFRPERWLHPASLPTSPAAFGGFSWGKRSCIGKPYAMMLLKTTLAHVVRRYRLAADHAQLRFQLDVVLKPTRGHHVSIEKRV